MDLIHLGKSLGHIVHWCVSYMFMVLLYLSIPEIPINSNIKVMELCLCKRLRE